MSIDKHLEAKGVQLADDNSLPAGTRTQKTVKRVIAAVRAAEAEFNDELRQSRASCCESQQLVIQLQEQVRKLQEELRHHRVKETMDHIEALTTADRRKLLEVA